MKGEIGKCEIIGQRELWEVAREKNNWSKFWEGPYSESQLKKRIRAKVRTRGLESAAGFKRGASYR